MLLLSPNHFLSYVNFTATTKNDLKTFTQLAFFWRGTGKGHRYACRGEYKSLGSVHVEGRLTEVVVVMGSWKKSKSKNKSVKKTETGGKKETRTDQ